MYYSVHLICTNVQRGSTQGLGYRKCFNPMKIVYKETQKAIIFHVHQYNFDFNIIGQKFNYFFMLLCTPFPPTSSSAPSQSCGLSAAGNSALGVDTFAQLWLLPRKDKFQFSLFRFCFSVFSLLFL